MRTSGWLASLLVFVGCGGGGGARPALPLRDVALGASEACAIDRNGEVWCWGNARAFVGELSMSGPDNTCVAPFVAAGTPSVFGACITPAPQKPKLVAEALAGSKAVALSAGFGLCVLTDDGKVRCWKDNAFVVTSGDLVITQFDTNSVGWCGLTASGAAWCYVGANTEPLRAMPGGQVFKRVSTGAFTILALDADSNVWASTLDAAPRTTELIPSTPLPLATGGPVKDAQVSAQFWATRGQPFEANTCRLETTGAITCTGWNTYGQLGNGQLRASGGGTGRVTSLVASEVAVGSTHVCALREGGEVSCWGSSFAGELGGAEPMRCDIGGNMSVGCSPQPLPVSGLKDVTHLWAGINFTCAELKSGELKCWGANDTGQLGNATGLQALTTTIGL